MKSEPLATAGPVTERTIIHVVGARPNFMKIAPLMEAMRAEPRFRQVLVNTGQHYDEKMAGGFFRELKLPTPDRDLGVGSGTHAVQTAKVMVAFEDACLELKPDLVVVVGDVNSTMAATLVAAKLGIRVAHVEAGLRSGDRTMPEEINRIVTDRLADLLLTPSRDGDEHLLAEGVPPERIRFVGNIMIDTLHRHLPMATFDRIRDRVPVEPGQYAVLTLHRPSNVDHPATFESILAALRDIARDLPIVFPVHPRTRARMAEFGIDTGAGGFVLTEPLGYIDFLSLTSHARLILTDSGGLQEESTALGIPCLTLRENTERPVTITHGTNQLVGTRTEDILAGYRRATTGAVPEGKPELWDGRTAERITGVFREFLR
ncbi:MAG: UDP-N-acetylglucosamine 2-epimerase (non-hydrolyzing) [Vicinamibacterales bacterium]|nr:UDP-N-acetylglucosamine 2-epimerase (non-hydrolyzing) [Vicinamibacterales bacterium]